MSGIVKLAALLEACTAPSDEVAVGGILQRGLAAVLPPDLMAEEPADTLVKNCFRTLTALRSLRESHLRELGFGMGEPAIMHDVIQPKAMFAPPVPTVQGLGGAQDVAVDGQDKTDAPIP
jgi:hypothetical protein